MSDTITLTLTPRQATGKKVSSLRKSGHIPAVAYGHDFKATNLQAPEVAFTKVVNRAGTHHLVELDIDGKKELGLIKSIDIDPVKHVLRHVAFHIVKQNQKIETHIPIKLVGEGESDAEKAGLVVLQTLDNLAVRALPKNLPDSFEADITMLSEIGQTLTIADITVPAGVELIEEDMAITVANVYEPSALAAANEATGGDAEPGDEADVEAESGEDTPQDSQDGEIQPGGKKEFEDKEHGRNPTKQ